MKIKHVVVDGSNIATEGRSLPSLQQLDEAVRAFLAEYTTEHVTVIVDATFGHRIDPSERDAYEAAVDANEIVTPPAGAIGRGDAFVLQVADRVGATILSNDSFQEFHGQYTWLFDEGRLMGGKPVLGVGWVFLLRTPVRGPTSRRAVREAKDGREPRKAKAAKSARPAKAAKAAKSAAPAAKGAKKSGRAANEEGARARRRGKASTDAAPHDETAARPRRRPLSQDAVNEPLAFIEFVANHPVGSIVEGEVERFASHGAYVAASGARCYVPLKSLGTPAPRSAKDVLTIGEVRSFTVTAFDAPRRGIDLMLADVREDGAERAESRRDETREKPQRAGKTSDQRKVAARSRGRGDEERNVPRGTDRDSVASAKEGDRGARRTTRVPAASRKTNTSPSNAATNSGTAIHAEEAPVTPAKKKAAKKKAAKKAPAKKKAAARKAPAKRKAAKKAPAKKKKAAKKAPAKKKAAKKAPAKRKAAKKAPAKKKKAAKKAPAKRKAAAKKR